MAGACELGALDGGAAAAAGRARRFRAFGEAVGLAFQIADDVMDFVGVPSETGKRPGTDLREGKVTLPLLHALRSLPKRPRARLAALARRRRLPSAEYDALVRLIHDGDGFAYAWRRAHAFARRAKALLAGEPAGPIRDSLSLAVDYAVQRTR
jgi:octaprenyl-diphosphate synthase